MCKCNKLFTDFTWKDLETLDPKELPDVPGVYTIRIKQKGKPISEIKQHVENFLKKTNWKPFKQYVQNRISRLENIGGCPIIYIGAAPNTLRGRYEDLCGRRHTALYPILALLTANWKLQLGYKQTTKTEAKQTEQKLKQKYQQTHKTLPALVKR